MPLQIEKHCIIRDKFDFVLFMLSLIFCSFFPQIPSFVNHEDPLRYFSICPFISADSISLLQQGMILKDNSQHFQSIILQPNATCRKMGGEFIIRIAQGPIPGHPLAPITVVMGHELLLFTVPYPHYPTSLLYSGQRQRPSKPIILEAENLYWMLPHDRNLKGAGSQIHLY